MTFSRTRLLIAGLTHYWRSHAAVALGAAVAAAVLAGALIVGDSVRASLRAMTLDRLGDVDFALSGPRFVQESLAERLASAAAEGGDAVHAAPAIVLTAAAEAASGDEHRRAGGVTMVGCDERLWSLLPNGDLAPPQGDEVILSRRAADQLAANVGDEVSLLVEIPATIPRDALLGDREETVAELLLRVSAVAEESTGLARFGLNPSQQLPLNAFVDLRTAQEQLGVAATRASRTSPVAKPSRVNALLLSRNPRRPSDDRDVVTATALTSVLHQQLELADLHLRLVTDADRGAVSLESEQMMLDLAIEEAGRKVGQVLNRAAQPVLVYLINEIASEADPERHSMYGVAAGVDFGGPDAVPAPGNSGGATAEPEAVLEVAINAWLAEDLDAQVGDVLIAKYLQVGDRGELPEVTRRFRVREIVPLSPPWDDRGLVPYVPGISDAETFREWRQPFPMAMDRITDRDEEYWKAHRATPKVFLPLAEARDLWRSRYGAATSLRYTAESESADALAAEVQQRFLAELRPVTTGLAVLPVKQQGLQAASGTTDFAGLFLGFSIFLIGAAAILIALLFRLGVERRIRELGLLTAIGWRSGSVFRHALAEAMAVVAAGALLGLPLAVGYAALMIYGLKTWWNAAVGTQFLFVSVEPSRLAIGAASAALVAAASVWLGLRSARRISPRAMLSGVVDAEGAAANGGAAVGSRWRGAASLACAAAAAVLVGGSLAGMVPAAEAFGGIAWTAVAFFLSGGLALAAGMLGLSAFLRRPSTGARRGALSLRGLCLRNAARNPRRSSMTAGLVAAAAFLVAAVASGRRNPAAELPATDSGNGGFLLVAESTTPILYDLNTPAGRAQLGIVEARWPDVRVVPFRVQPGENASCLNLYQTQLPTILALPDGLIRDFAEAGRFKFVGQTPADAWNSLLAETHADITPVLGDVNTLQYSLHKGVGDRVALDDAPSRSGRELEVVGMFDGSVFQGVLVMALSRFESLFPERAGYQYFLVESSAAATASAVREQADDVAGRMESQLRDYGLDAERVAERLADFLAVQNTYLSTFQTLGGLGLLLGVFGLFAVMLRNVVERRGELALLRAVGLPDRRTRLVVIGENLLLVGWGLGLGIGAALLAMAPHLASTGAMPPWGGLGLLAASVLAAGLIAALAALRDALRTPIVTALRDE
ncbi:MAG: ABC transporter permease [Planctomyces sp.]|nr:ABC transporter permease [Planctomyces sp.]